MGNVAVGKASEHMENGIHFADITEELVSEPFPSTGTLDETRDVHEFKIGRDDLFRLCRFSNASQSRVRHAYPA